MSSSSTASLANPTPAQLHAIVLNYLCHSCYTGTARAFNKDSTIRQLDADGDEIIEDAKSDDSESGSSSNGLSESFQTLLRQVELRQEIRTQIMSGRVDDAITLLNKHFPSVLSEEKAAESAEPRPSSSNIEYVSSTSTEPAHLDLNLRILAFSEACRTIPLEYPPKSAKSTSSDSTTPPTEPTTSTPKGDESKDASEQQMALLIRAQKLYAFSTTLPNPADRATYLKELENVGGLLAYKVPEKSSMSKYLTLERREAVADQINRAILKRTSRPLVSSLELITRHTNLLWLAANEYGVKVRLGAVLPPRSSKGTDSSDGDIVPTFDLHHFLDMRP